jgi:MFS family permease
MQLRAILNRFRMTSGDFVPAFALVVNSFAWYSSVSVIFTDAVNHLPNSTMENILIFMTFYVGIAVSAILGSVVIKGTRKSLLLVWIFAGIIASLLLNTIGTSSHLVSLVVSLFLGISIGIGLPSCLAFFADFTGVENRGLFGGVTYGVSALAMFSIGYMSSTLTFSTMVLVLAAWRCLGLIALVPLIRKGSRQAAQSPSFFSILSRRTVVLYLIPWIMFCLVNWTEAPLVQKSFGDFYNFAIFAEFAISGIFTIIGGLFADLIGRKRVTIVGFVMLGIEYAFLSLLSGIDVSQYLYIILDGAAWGMLSVVFFMVLWGDLAENMKKEKYYVIGGLPYLLAGFLSVIVKPYIETINVSTAFSLASFFLFLAVLPLMYAPETLPEKKLEERELKGYIEKAKKLKEKRG